MIAMKKIEFRSNRYVLEGGGVIIKKRTNILIKKKHIKKCIIPLFNSLFLCQDIFVTLFMASNPTQLTQEQMNSYHGI